MKKLGYGFIAALTALMPQTQDAQATSVVWSALGAGVVQLDDSFVPAGSLVRLGFFDVSDASVQANATNLTYLDAHFTVFGFALVGDNVLGQPGFWSAETFVHDPTSIFDGRRMVIWVFNAPTMIAATQHGIFTNNSDPDWLFPDDDAVIDTTAIDLEEVNTILVGSAGPVVGIPGIGDFNTFRLAIIPEPATSGLVGLAILGLAFIRRRTM